MLDGPATRFEFSTARKCPTKFIGTIGDGSATASPLEDFERGIVVLLIVVDDRNTSVHFPPSSLARGPADSPGYVTSYSYLVDC